MKWLIPIAVATLLALFVSPAQLQAQYAVQSADEQSSQLFHNMFTTGPGTQTAAMYPAPHPTPRVAGHVFYTYQPFAPHQMMYEHNRTYYTPYGGPGGFYQDPCANGRCGQPIGDGQAYNVTTVVWQNGGTFVTPYPGQFRANAFRLPGQNRPFGGNFGGRLGGHGAPSAACATCQ